MSNKMDRSGIQKLNIKLMYMYELQYYYCGLQNYLLNLCIEMLSHKC